MGVGQNYYQDNLKNKTFSEILENQSTEIYANHAALKLVALTFVAKSTEDIVKALNDHKQSVNENTKSNTKLSKRLLWLNIILGIFTIIGAIFGILAFINQ